MGTAADLQAGGAARPETDQRLVRRSLRALGRPDRVRAVTRLTDGRSGAQVFRVDDAGTSDAGTSDAGTSTVLKIIERRPGDDRADRELAVYQELGAARVEFLPRLVAGARDDETVWLLLTGHPPYSPAATLTDAQWVTIARQLGRLHAVPVPPAAWLRRRLRPSPQQVTAAVAQWERRGCGELARRGARQLHRVASPPSTLPDVLSHGDCHVDNLVRGPDDRPRWIDWSEACLGSGLDDLAFLWQRAEFAGARPPRSAMTSAYAAGRSLSPEIELGPMITAVELRLLLIEWPPFLAHGSHDRQRLMTDRLQEVTRDLDHDP